MIPDTMIYLIAIFVGCLIRAVAPFIRKWLSNEVPEGWNHQYTITLLISYIVSLVATAFVYQMNPLNVVNGETIFFKGFIL